MNYWVLYTDTRVLPADLMAWRGALGQEMKPRPAWHNHDPDTGKHIHRYPQVQYKILRHALAITCLEAESQALFSLSQTLPKTYWINNRPRTLVFRALERSTHHFEFLPKAQVFRCNNWIPMNSKQYQSYRALSLRLDLDPGARLIKHPELLTFFEGLFTEQLRWHLRGFGYGHLINQICCVLDKSGLQHFQTSYYHNVQVSMIKDMVFSLNLHWPPALGFGIGAAVGYGMFTKTR